MEDLVNGSYRGARVFVTGHTGFKGSWLTLWLHRLGARVTGYALRPDTMPSMFDALDVASACRTHYADVRDFECLANAIDDADPDFVFHLAAQPLVRRSYAQPLETIQTNVLGTANVLEVVRQRGRPCAVVVVTSDKCYESADHAHRETDPMGGHDVYSMSKGAAELVVSSYRRSFGLRVATARAGNVIGGGDFAEDRIVPDFVRAVTEGEELRVRNPAAVRPWQHVLEPLSGYLLLGARIQRGDDVCDAWNFGPEAENEATVAELVDAFVQELKVRGSRFEGRISNLEPRTSNLHESPTLRLNIDKAKQQLGWHPRWNLAETVARTVEWYCAFDERPASVRELTLAQIGEYA